LYTDLLPALKGEAFSCKGFAKSFYRDMQVYGDACSNTYKLGNQGISRDVGLGEPGSVAKDSIIAQWFISSSSPGSEALNLFESCSYKDHKFFQYIFIEIECILRGFCSGFSKEYLYGIYIYLF
jgi:hypothetical protein